MVIRESDASWVGATLRESMLKPRPEIMPVTRAKTPKVFSTRTEIVCRMKNFRERMVDAEGLEPPTLSV